MQAVALTFLTVSFLCKSLDQLYHTFCHTFWNSSPVIVCLIANSGDTVCQQHLCPWPGKPAQSITNPVFEF